MGSARYPRIAPEQESSVASALLLGDNAAMSADEWDRYVRTGVIHVLAISGQHLVILGAFLWFTLRLVGVRRRPAAMIVALVLLTYAMMTGWRPSAARAAIMTCSYCGAIFLRTNPMPGYTYAASALVKTPPGSAGNHAMPWAANTFSLAWLTVLGFNPTDLFTPGFQLSFLAVAVLIWGIPVWFRPRQRTPLTVDHESRSTTGRTCVMVRGIRRMYLISSLSALRSPLLPIGKHNLAGRADWSARDPADHGRLIAGFLLLLLWPPALSRIHCRSPDAIRHATQS
jgi:competence protein ComEC